MNAPATVAERPRAKRHAKGKRPHFYGTEGLDEAMAMIMVLAQEFCVLRDRLDATERVLARHGIDATAEIEALVLDQPGLEAREARRQEFFERLFYVVRKQAAEMGDADTAERYRSVIDDIATN